MTLFSNSPDDWQKLDWQMLRDGGVALYRQPEYLTEDVRWLVGRNYDIYTFDCEHWASDSEMFSDFARVLGFSECSSFDTVEDHLSDLPIREDGGTALVFRRFNVYATGAGSALMSCGRARAGVLLDVMARVCRFHLLNGTRFVTLVQTVDPDYRAERLGAVSATWNRREWVDAKRRPESRNEAS